jgi:hypothetical protein
MPPNDIESRRKRFFRLSSEIAQIGEEQFFRLLEASKTDQGWGHNHTLEIGGDKVFVKRIPLTDLEYEHPFSTRNVYGMPTYYNYGVGSAGFGVHRELVANIKATNWVLDGEVETFPLLYGYRIRRATGERPPMDMERHNRYVAYWGGDENIGRYMLDRATARHEVVLFLEHFPDILRDWVQANPQGIAPMLDQLRTTIDFLRSKGMIHFDAHYHNIMTDGVRPYLTDFGLVLDNGFDLSPSESTFFELNRYYDYGEVLSCLSYLIDDVFDSLPISAKNRVLAEFAIDEATFDKQHHRPLIEMLDKFATLAPVDLTHLAMAKKYKPVILLMRDFYASLRADHTKQTPLPAAALLDALVGTGFVGDRPA